MITLRDIHGKLRELRDSDISAQMRSKIVEIISDLHDYEAEEREHEHDRNVGRPDG